MCRVRVRIEKSPISLYATSMEHGCAHQHNGHFMALEVVIYRTARPALRCLAALGIVSGLNSVLFSLTGHCEIPDGSLQFAAAQMRLQRFNEAPEGYRLNCGRYPDSGTGLEALVSNPGVKGWNGPYVKEPLRDPWNRPFLYEISNGIPIVRSLGAHGKRGGDLFDADISSLAPLAPIPESAFHAERAFFSFWIAPWLLLLASVDALIRTHPQA
jgi:type II secretion system protein G